MYWEKTVEWAFVYQLAKSSIVNNQLLSPLAGVAESKLADAIIALNDKFLLIEFKKDLQGLQQEREKFGGENFLQKMKASYSEENSRFHQIVYLNKYKSLSNISYLYEEDLSFVKANVYEYATDENNFSEYCKHLANAKKDLAENGEGGTTGSFVLRDMPDVYVILGVNEKGEVTSVFKDYNQFCLTLNKPPIPYDNPKPELKPDETPKKEQQAPKSYTIKIR